MKVELNLTNRQLVLLTGILGTCYSEETFDIYEQLYPFMTEEKMEIVDEFVSKFINVNIDESEILDDALEDIIMRKFG